MLIEQNTSYALKIKNTINLSFDKIRSIAVKNCLDLSQQERDELYEKLRRGVDLIDSEELMYVYIYSYGQMHQAKLNHAFQKLPNDFLKQKEINIIDYGCGQAFGTICYADFLKSKGINQNIKHITLIEPSVMCLKRAALHSSCIFKTAEIHTINKEFDRLTKEDLYIDEHIPTLHILSNVLDMQSFILEDFAEVVRTSLKGYNFFICVGPYFGIYDKDLRMKKFASYLNGENIKSEQLSKNMLMPDKDWTCQTYCFNVGEYYKELKKSTPPLQKKLIAGSLSQKSSTQILPQSRYDDNYFHINLKQDWWLMLIINFIWGFILFIICESLFAFLLGFLVAIPIWVIPPFINVLVLALFKRIRKKISDKQNSKY